MTRLTGAQFQSIVTSMRSLASPLKATQVETATKGRIAILPLDQKLPTPAVVNVIEFTPTTIGFEMPRSLKVGTKILLCLSETATSGNRGIVCVVARWFPMTSSSCFVGATFLGEVASPISMAEVEQTIAAEELRQFADSGA